MQSAENGFKKHHLIPFSKKKNNKGGSRFPHFKRRKTSRTTLSLNENTFHTSSFMANNEIVQENEHAIG